MAKLRSFVRALACCCACLGAGVAIAQYREGVPPVMPAPAADSAKEKALQAFQARYAALGRPRVVLYWNVDLSPEVTSTQKRSVDETARGTSDEFSSEKTTKGEAGSATLKDRGAQRADRRTQDTTVKWVDPAVRPRLLGERDDYLVMSTFQTALRAAGMPLIDRAAIVRREHADRYDAAADPKRYESLALQSGADMVLELLQTADKSSPLGIGFRISMKSVRHGHDVFSLYSRAIPVEASKTRLVATERGFEKQPVLDKVGPVDAGGALAWDVITALASTH